MEVPCLCLLVCVSSFFIFWYLLRILLNEVIVLKMQFKKVDGLSSSQYAVAVRLSPEPMLSDVKVLNQQQSVRTCGRRAEACSSSELDSVKWSEVFFFKVDSPVCQN